MKAIVYTSQTGHTQRYAQMLAERTGVPAYSLKEAGKSLRRGEEIFYMGWLMAGTVKGLQSAMDRYTIRGAAIVGVSPQGNGDLWTEARINGGYSDSGGRLFYNGFISYRPGARPGFRRKEGRRMLTDIEIAQQAHMLPITEVAAGLGIDPDDL